MEAQENIAGSLFEATKEYTRTSIELLKLKAIDKGAEIASSLASNMAVIIALIFFLLAFNIAIALWIGDLLGKSYYGFFTVAAFYAIVILVMHFFMKGWMRKKVSNSIVKQAFN
jgi:hypothetical protein